MGEGGGRRDEKSLQADLGQMEEGVEGVALFHSNDQGWNASVSYAGNRKSKIALLGHKFLKQAGVGLERGEESRALTEVEK